MIIPLIAEISTPCGRMWISGDDERVIELSWSVIRGVDHEGELDWIIDPLEAYFSGEKTRFPGSLSFAGKQPVWVRETEISLPRRISESALLAVSHIPFGRVRTYGDIARSLGNPHLARAVGQACRNNPIPIIVPCHRVVGRGSLGGFSSGLFRKEILLQLEGISCPG